MDFQGVQAHYRPAMTTTNIALILWNTDVIDLMSLVLLQWKLTSRGVEPSQGEEAIEQWIASYNPKVVVFDLDPPYARSGAVVSNLIRRFPEQSFVLTCADPILALVKAPALFAHPIFQKPYEPDELAKTVASLVPRVSDRDASKKYLSPARTEPCGMNSGVERSVYSLTPSTAAETTAAEAAATKAAARAEAASYGMIRFERWRNRSPVERLD
jgi:DNA-binding NarL/FixJ family response regulator